MSESEHQQVPSAAEATPLPLPAFALGGFAWEIDADYFPAIVEIDANGRPILPDTAGRSNAMKSSVDNSARIS